MLHSMKLRGNQAKMSHTRKAVVNLTDMEQKSKAVVYQYIAMSNSASRIIILRSILNLSPISNRGAIRDNRERKMLDTYSRWIWRLVGPARASIRYPVLWRNVISNEKMSNFMWIPHKWKILWLALYHDNKLLSGEDLWRHFWEPIGTEIVTESEESDGCTTRHVYVICERHDTMRITKNWLMIIIFWAAPGGTAIPGQPVAKVEQAPDTSPIFKNQFNIVVAI